jgi:acyl-coenzyme A thioesterase PaaI-like protein
MPTVKATRPLAEVMTQAVQDQYAPNGICFGCGPANPDGLQIKSHWEGAPLDGGELVMHFNPEQHHQAFPGVVNGGILGALLDCHSNWCAATAIMTSKGWDRAEPTVTADFHVKLKRPTPYPAELTVRARVTTLDDRTATIHAEVEAGGKITATCDGTFVAVKEGHPAYHRWE